MHPVLEARGLSKSFPGVQALADVDLELRPGEVLAVVGENGAGKSTLMKILAGIQAPDAGELRLDGQPVEIRSTRRAAELGIALIHQELNLADNLAVGPNVFLGREPRRFGLIDHVEIERRTAEVLARIEAGFTPSTPVSSLSVGQRQSVEIAKALSQDARVLIMDEPTSSLSARETESLVRVIRELVARGVSIVYVSHRLGEVIELADRVLVLRDGRVAGHLARHVMGSEITHDNLVRLMVGRDVIVHASTRRARAGRALLEVDGLRTAAHPAQSLSFRVAPGEIVGIAGLVGSGRSELLRALFGVEPALGGSVRVAGEPVTLDTPVQAIRAGLGLVPEDRKREGLFLELSVADNVGIATLRRRARGGLIDHPAERELARGLAESLSIKTPGLDQPAGLLSGGNQQKVVLAKWLAAEPRLLLLDEPTRGIDVGARQEIYTLMEELAGRGVGILFASSEMEEVLAMSDRTLVMHEGRIAGELLRHELSEEAVMHLATGGGASAA